MAVVIETHKHETIMDEIKELYFCNATLNLNQKDKEDFEESKPCFLKFLEEDQRCLLKEINSPVEKSKRLLKFFKLIRDKRLEQV